MNTISGQKFGRLVAKEPTDEIVRKSQVWLCVCECGNEKRTRRAWLLDGRVQSCGCLRRETSRALRITHGDTGTSEHRIWCDMRRRCHSLKSRGYQFYGGRGIKVCKRWCDSYEMFLADMGRRPSTNHSIERIDNDGNYEPANCRWGTCKEQANNRRSNVHIEIDGEMRSLSEWLVYYGVKRGTYEMRITSGFSRIEALTRPVRKYAYI